MNFDLPEIHDMTVELGGIPFEGSWYVIMGNLIVNYNGYTQSVPFRDSTVAEAREMLQHLIRIHYIGIEQIPASIPHSIREAAHAYANSGFEEEPTHLIVASFGESIAGSMIHRQVSWLCVNALEMVVPTWKHICDDDAPEQTMRSMKAWLTNPSHSIDWDAACQPSEALSEGVRIRDCDACRVEPIAKAVAFAAKYLRSAESDMAAESLRHAGYAFDEGCYLPSAPERFQKWLVCEALPRALRCEPFDPQAP